jgi:hypothetical protein
MGAQTGSRELEHEDETAADDQQHQQCIGFDDRQPPLGMIEPPENCDRVARMTANAVMASPGEPRS